MRKSAHILSVLFSTLGFANAEASKASELILEGTATIIVVDQEGRPGKWVFEPAPKIVQASEVLRSYTPYLEGRYDISLRKASTGTSGDIETDCADHEVSIPFGASPNAADITNFAASIEANGHFSAPEAAIGRAVSDLKDAGGGRVLYITDGTSTCEDDPFWIAETAGESVAIDVLALGNAIDLQSLSKLALASQGRFFLADTPGSLSKLMGPLLDEVLPNGGGAGTLDLAEVPSGDIPPLDDDDSETETESLTGPLFPGRGSGGVSNVNTGIEQCPAYDVLSQQLLDYANGNVSDEPVQRELPVAVAFILDASGSMAGRQNGRTKMSIAQEALAKVLPELDGTNVVTSLWAYGFDTGLAKTPEASCPNTSELVPFNQNQSRLLTSTANRLPAYGYTPLGQSIRLAGASLQATDASRHIAVLITDGEETCDGDPVIEAERLAQSGIDVTTYVVGYDLDGPQRAELERVAAAGGTDYLDAADGRGLAMALSEVVEVVAEKTERIAPSCLNPISGGETPAEATVLPEGIYTIGELLDPGSYRYYRFATSEGQRAIIKGLIQSRAYVDVDGKPTESGAALAAYSLEVLYPDGSPTVAQSARAVGLPGQGFAASFVDTTGEGFVLGVGDNYRRVPPESLFKVEFVDFSDNGAGDGGTDPKGDDAIALGRQRSAEGHFGAEDIADAWRFDALPGAKLTISLSFSNPDPPRYRIAVFDEASGKRLARVNNGAASVEAAGPVRILVENRSPALRPILGAYTLEITDG